MHERETAMSNATRPEAPDDADSAPVRHVRWNMMLPWLFPLALVGAVLAVAFAPNWLVGVLGFLVFTALGWVGVPLYSRLRYRRSDGSGESQ